METVLCNADKSTFWANFSWKQYVELEDKENTLVILPVVGCADWGLGHALDVEETVLMELLKRSIDSKKDAIQFRVTPPLRFAMAPYAHTFFGVDVETAHDMLEELINCIKIAGFKKVVLLNSSPWNEEFVDVVGRDVRISHALSMFCVNMSGLGFDLEPERSNDRRNVQTVVTHLTGHEPEVWNNEMPAPVQLPLRPGSRPEMIPLIDEPVSLSEAADEAESLLNAAAIKLGTLFDEIKTHPPLKNDGTIPVKE